MDAPKKIWILPSGRPTDMPIPNHGPQYIRADLVDGLVEALEIIAGGWVCVDEAGLTARAALKALEEPE